MQMLWGFTMSLDNLKQQLVNQQMNAMQLGHQLKKHQQQLDELFPQQAPLAAKFHAYVHGATTAICDQSNKFRTWLGWDQGFRQFCGNQGSCVCNRQHAQTKRSEKTVEQQELIVEKRKQTNIKKYGAEFASQTTQIKNKTLETCMRKYGARSPTSNREILKKISQTCMQNHGTAWPQQNPEIFAKTQMVFQELFGVDKPAQHPEIREQLRTMRRQQGYDLLAVNYPQVIPMFDQTTYMQADFATQLEWKCVECDNIWSQTKRPHEDPRCIICHPARETWGETAIKKWLVENNQKFVQWDREQISPLELDFWLPDHKIGIEFNGTWYHREDAVPSRNYHQQKFSAAHKKGIKLIQIWEHELMYKPQIVMDRLAHVINFHNKKIAARKCQIQPIDHMIAREFFNTHHLQGHQNSKHIYGLFCNNQLIAAASFVPVRYNKKAEWELLRYATVGGHQVQGGLSRLLAHAQKTIGFKSLLTYANLNWGMGNAYAVTGFVLDHISKPNYWYFRGLKEIHSRIKFQKHKIIGEAPGNSEKEIAQNMGYHRFFDAGNSVWIKHW